MRLFSGGVDKAPEPGERLLVALLGVLALVFTGRGARVRGAGRVAVALARLRGALGVGRVAAVRERCFAMSDHRESSQLEPFRLTHLRRRIEPGQPLSG